jgi:hypothetical protein
VNPAAAACCLISDEDQDIVGDNTTGPASFPCDWLIANLLRQDADDPLRHSQCLSHFPTPKTLSRFRCRLHELPDSQMNSILRPSPARGAMSSVPLPSSTSSSVSSLEVVSANVNLRIRNLFFPIATSRIACPCR